MKNYKIVFGPSFKRDIKHLEKRFPHIKEDLHLAINLLLKQPRIGPVIPHSSGMRKLRVPNRDQKRGKRGGYRLIYCVKEPSVPTIYLLLLYSKADKKDLTTHKVRELQTELADTQKTTPIKDQDS